LRKERKRGGSIPKWAERRSASSWDEA